MLSTPQASFPAFFSEGQMRSPVSKTRSGECNAITIPILECRSASRCFQRGYAESRGGAANTVKSLEVNTPMEPSFFAPPQFERTPLQRMLEQLYMERTDPVCVIWTYRGFRAAHPKMDTREGVEFIGYQLAKMRDFKSALDLLTANATDYPHSASAQFGLGRAYKAAGDLESARLHFNQALEIDPKFKKATDGLDALK